MLVTGISPTPAGEGKTTTTIGLGDALRRIGQRAMICLREPSLGPCFGVKGGATGGGMAQVAPMAEINLHFTGDFHAITAANNLLAAMLDNHLYWGNALGIDPRRVTWRRALDMNDRALRQVVDSLGGVANGSPREDGFDITVASEVMAVFCLARDLADLQDRLGRMVVATRRDGSAITARDLKADGAMAALLRDALQPNLVQTLEGSPGAGAWRPVRQHRARLQLGDRHPARPEAGRCGGDGGRVRRRSGRREVPGHQVPLGRAVAGLLRGGGDGAGAEDARRRGPRRAGGGGPGGAAPRPGQPARHVENMRKFGLPVIVALNRFTTDTAAEFALVSDAMGAQGVDVVACNHWAEGSAGAETLARSVMARLSKAGAAFQPLYPDAMGLADKLRTVAREIYRADDIALAPAAAKRLAAFEAAGTARCRCASPRPSTASPPMPRCSARQPATCCRCGRCGCPPAPASWWRCAATS